MIKHILLLGTAVASLAGLTEAAQAQTAASPYTYATRYDQLGRVAGTISPNDSPRGYSTFLATRTSYDAVGRPYKVETGRLDTWQSEQVLPENWGSAFFAFKTVETTYNADNQKVTEWVKGHDLVTYSLTQFSYDSAGRLECTAVRMNTAAYGSLPPSACTLGTEGAYGPDRIVRNVYDAAGQLVQVREGVGTSVEIAEVTYSYTNNGKVEYVVDAGGHKALKCYDTFDRQSRWVFPSQTNPSSFNDSTPALALGTAGAVNGTCIGSTGDYEEYGYDNNGNRTSLRKRDGQTLSYQYDLLNRYTVKVVPGSTTSTRDVYYSYDLRGLMTSARFDGTSGEGIIFQYDGFGRKIYETTTMDGVSRTLGSQYDRDGNRIRLTYPDTNYIDYYLDGLDRLYYSSLNGAAPLFYTPFDGAGRLSMLYRWNPSAANWYAAISSFAYDSVSRLAAFSYDLPQASYDMWSTSFTYNPANQIASTTRTNDLYAFSGYTAVNRPYLSDGLNQYDSVNGVTFTHDLNGNLSSDGTYSFTYDPENRMVGRTGGGTTVTLRYDPLGRLYNSTDGVNFYTRYLYDGDARVVEYDYNYAMIRRYVHGTSAGDDPQVLFEGVGVSDAERRYLIADERGSIVALTDSLGTVINVNRYDEYGIPAATNVGRFQYTGQAWIPELGMYYYKARMYSPTLGRFMQTDPIGYDDQFNLYAYVGNDPINGNDPSGLLGVSCNTITTGNATQTFCSFRDDGNDDLTTITYSLDGIEFGREVVEGNAEQNVSVAAQVISSIEAVTGTPVGLDQLTPKAALYEAQGLARSEAASNTPRASDTPTRGDGTSAGSGRSGSTASGEANYWRGLDRYRGDIKTDGSRYYKFDRRHGEVEVYDKQGRHLGTQNANTGAWEKPAVAGRNIRNEL